MLILLKYIFILIERRSLRNLAGGLCKMFSLASIVEDIPRDVYELETSDGTSRSVEQGEFCINQQTSILHAGPRLSKDENT